VNQEPIGVTPQDPGPAEVKNPVSAVNVDLAGFKNATTLTKWVKILFVFKIALALMAINSNRLQYMFMYDVKNFNYTSDEKLKSDTEANDARQKIVGFSQIGTSVTCFIVFLVWVHRSNFNARNLGAQSMKFTPGWSVGWFFIPIVNLWKPYQVIKDIWKNSSSNIKPETHFITAWWVLWLGSALFSRFAPRPLNPNGLDEWKTYTMIMVTSEVLEILSIITTLILVSRLFKMQMDRWGQLQAESEKSVNSTGGGV
jgi:hypothetical protein